MQFGIRQLARRTAFAVRDDLDHHVTSLRDAQSQMMRREAGSDVSS
jgi:hypothetical protein